MYRIIDGRGTGKTSRLFLIAKENDATVICKNPKALQEKAYCYGIIGLNFISYEEAVTSDDTVLTESRSVVVDELEAFLSYLFDDNINLIGYTLTNED